MEMPFRIYVVEDDDWYRELLNYNLELNPDYEVKSFQNGSDFLKKLHEKPDVVTLDYRLPDMEGAEVLRKIKDFDPDIEVIVISGQDNIETAVNLLKAGAYDYLVKTQDIRDRLLNVVNNIRKNNSLKTRLNTLQQEVGKKYSFENSFVGQSPAIRRVYDLIEKAINNNITVTITGETGTGKEVVAKAIHFNSQRRDFPFVPVNMAAIPKDLLESELFGHEKGAFTGANNRRIGKFEEAHKGTLFLDEIGEMDIAIQAKLLRALQEKEIGRIGSNKLVSIDARIIVATNRNLKEEVKAGNFREDLYYRLLGLPIELPPLRERGQDIILLARHFVERFATENGMPAFTFSPEAQRKLLAYSWPGNIRELRSVVELAAVMSNADIISPDVISLGAQDVLSEALSEEMTLRAYEYRILDFFLKKYNNNIKLVAEKLDIGQATIYRMLKEMRGEKPD